jgi:hypothetical protein
MIDIIKLANDAGWQVADLDDGFGTRLVKFAALVEKATRDEMISAQQANAKLQKANK